MADPSSDINKWISFGWDDKSRGVVAVASFITEAGKTNSDYAVFAPEWFPFYGSQIAMYGKGVDPDTIEPYINAWIKYSADRKISFTAPLAQQAMIAAGLERGKATVVANAMYHVNAQGKLPTIIVSPAGWAQNAGIGPSDVSATIEKILGGFLTISKMLPWLLVGVGVFIAWPYIAAARKPAKLLGG